ncbi:hypothetical protein TIFTF001_027799 [Ficus carica]|uniref:Uncharacterized protein n=1 Tax=Ficus carica TaxID=3494 RepID=A0AA88DNM9_FICCA|nr:hypothetical protein TIFTF001_027799 [Ficus carica]
MVVTFLHICTVIHQCCASFLSAKEAHRTFSYSVNPRKSKITWISINQLSASIGSVGPSNSGAFIHLKRSYNKSSLIKGGSAVPLRVLSELQYSVDSHGELPVPEELLEVQGFPEAELH